MTTTDQKLSALRKLMRQHKLDAYFVPSSDAHLNEYVPECWQRRSWLSGFTGSAGDVLVLGKSAGLWTDGRYYLQAEQQLEGSGIELFRSSEPGVLTIEAYLRDRMGKGKKVGVDPHVLSMARANQLDKELEKVGAKLVLIDTNLVDEIWTDRPRLPSAPVEVLAQARSGESTPSKLARVRKKMTERKVDALVITSLDAIAWTFNIRGQDIQYNPLVISYAVITEKQATLFVATEKLTPTTIRKLEKLIELRPYDDLSKELKRLDDQKARVWVDEEATNQWVGKQLPDCALETEPGPIDAMKAVKNTNEINGMRRAHERDGVAMVRFLRWLHDSVPKGGITELSAEEKLEYFRSHGPDKGMYRGPSFRTIAGYGPHGAIIHYSADEKTNSKLRPKGIFLLDSGGQYLDGTTDITRTILLGGKPTSEQRRAYTLVLKGHIALSRAVFPTGVRGMRLDTLARMHLWTDARDYGHGTGHGVGFFSNVHEGPQSISPVRCKGAPLEPGNILSNEPGYYAPGKYGIRIENLVLVVLDEKLSQKDKPWLAFEPLTLCPIDTALLDPSMLTVEERRWLNDYHKRVEKVLTPMLEDAGDRRWLKRACKAI